jgi:hypothetical protein
MIKTIFPANRKRLRVPAFVTVVERGWGGRRSMREHLVYWSRAERERDWRIKHWGARELYRINVYPRESL